VEVPEAEHRLPEVPTEEELRQFYQVVWQTRNFADMILIKTLFYTGVYMGDVVYLISYFAAGDGLRSDTPYSDSRRFSATFRNARPS
jgi:hypothetical protein